MIFKVCQPYKNMSSISSIIRGIHNISPLCYRTFPQVMEVIEEYGKSNPTDWMEWYNGQPGSHKLYSSNTFELELLFLQHKVPTRLPNQTLNAIKVMDGHIELETPRLFSTKLMPSHAVKEYWVRRPTVLTSVSNISNISSVLIGRLLFSK